MFTIAKYHVYWRHHQPSEQHRENWNFAVLRTSSAGPDVVRGSERKKNRLVLRVREDRPGGFVKQGTNQNVCINVSFLP